MAEVVGSDRRVRYLSPWLQDTGVESLDKEVGEEESATRGLMSWTRGASIHGPHILWGSLCVVELDR